MGSSYISQVLFHLYITHLLIADVENEDVCDMTLTADQAAEFTSAVTQQVCPINYLFNHFLK